MERVSIRFLWVLAFGLLFTGGCCTSAQPNTYQLPVSLEGQHQSNWCWAASGQMIMRYHTADVAQCTEVNDATGRTDCCNSPVPEECNVTGWPDFAKYGFSFDRTSSAPLGWQTIRDQIACNSHPLAFSWFWLDANGVADGTGHMMVIYGYETIDGQQWVDVNDPAPWDLSSGGSASLKLYSDYVSGPDHSHWDDFYNVQKKK